jgi:hypothetical protein
MTRAHHIFHERSTFDDRLHPQVLNLGIERNMSYDCKRRDKCIDAEYEVPRAALTIRIAVHVPHKKQRRQTIS